MRAKKSMEAKKKSNAFARIVEIIRISRGKYIFLIRLPLSTNEEVAVVSELIRNVQGSNPAYIKTGYGTVIAFPNLIIVENTKLIITIWKNGLRTTQNNPRNDCLYLTFISRIVRCLISSPYLVSSNK